VRYWSTPALRSIGFVWFNVLHQQLTFFCACICGSCFIGQAAAPKKEESWEEAEARKAKAAWQAKFDAVNWAVTEDMYGIWPYYMQEQIKLAKVKNVTKSFEIWPFTLKSITGGILLNETELKIEQNRKYVLLGDNGTLFSLFRSLILLFDLFLSCPSHLPFPSFLGQALVRPPCSTPWLAVASRRSPSTSRFTTARKSRVAWTMP
jgi:hypothetical protein